MFSTITWFNSWQSLFRLVLDWTLDGSEVTLVLVFSKIAWFISWSSLFPPMLAWLLEQIRRFQEYFNHIHILIGSKTLQSWQFWYQNGVNILFLVVKSMEVTSGFISKLLKKFARWRRHWKIQTSDDWNSLKTPTVPVRCWKFNNNILLLIT